MLLLKFLVSLYVKLRFKKLELLTTPFATTEVTTILSALTHKVNLQPQDRLSDLSEIAGVQTKFIGIVKEDFFCLSKKVAHPQSFLPRVCANFEETATLTHITLRYDLFPATKFWLVLFFVLSLGVTGLVILNGLGWFRCAIPSLVALGVYLVAVANFRIHCLDFRKLLEDELSLL